MLFKEKHVLKYTSDDFCPNINEHFVKLSLIQLSNKEYRVCVWGNDDLGFEKDFENLIEAESLFDSVYYFEDVSICLLKNNGFITA